jgi:ribonuclease E
MTKIMLIDATHPEETRVAVVDGRRLEEFDVEVASRHPLKGNIYLAKVTRVEPSLQAAFVEYGGNRHGFLAFSEIHPDYYRIPVADREALLREEMEEAEAEEVGGRDVPDSGESAPRMVPSEASGGEVGLALAGDVSAPAEAAGDLFAAPPAEYPVAENADNPGEAYAQPAISTPAFDTAAGSEGPAEADREGTEDTGRRPAVMPLAAPHDSLQSEPVAADEAWHPQDEGTRPEVADVPAGETAQAESDVPAVQRGDIVEVTQPPEVIDTVGGEVPAANEDDESEDDDDSARRRRQRHLRRYKIQEVIKRRQILLVQVTKEERGNKGAALTTYLSLAGRYCVLMPNTDRGGGISRRITSVADRKRLKSIVDELDPPEGMAVIVRTAGMERQRSEIKRDFEYLLRLWDEIRETTLRSSAPALIYEEASLIKRSIRDLYTRDIGDIVVAGTEAYKSAKSFMRMLAPAQSKRVQFYRDPSLPLFQRYQIESQIAAIHHPVVTLRSGGYIVINQTEALVAVDVNSGRSTRERNIEETALRTNLEAADEVARQLRLRDLAGLIVIDFIDMDEGRNNAAVERRMKDALRNDRARIQIGRISSFGLLEMSRQRLHASLEEASTATCPHCHGTGRMRSVDSTALHVLRMVEEEITRNPAPGVTVHVPTAVALFILNQKRHALAQLELRRGVRIYLNADDELTPPDFRLERLKQLAPGEELPAAPLPAVIDVEIDEAEEDDFAIEESDEAEAVAEADSAGDEETADNDNAERGQGRGRRRRRRRGRGGRFQADDFTDQSESAADGDAGEEDHSVPAGDAAEGAFEDRHRAQESAQHDSDEEDGDEDDEAPNRAEIAAGEGDETRRRRRRGRRGGRRRSKRQQDEIGSETQATGTHNGVAGEPAASGDAVLPGSGEQPEIPQDTTALPPQWRADSATLSPVTDETGEVLAESEPERGEKPRRPRRPRRPREDDARDGEQSEAAGVEPAPVAVETAVAATTIEQNAEDPNQPRKRGWWRRLIE